MVHELWFLLSCICAYSYDQIWPVFTSMTTYQLSWPFINSHDNLSLEVEVTTTFQNHDLLRLALKNFLLRLANPCKKIVTFRDYSKTCNFYNANTNTACTKRIRHKYFYTKSKIIKMIILIILILFCYSLSSDPPPSI